MEPAPSLLPPLKGGNPQAGAGFPEAGGKGPWGRAAARARRPAGPSAGRVLALAGASGGPGGEP
jgi:hypothetical protein